MPNKVRLRGVYGKPWSRMAGQIPVTPDLLDRLGKALVDAVVKEAKKDFAKQGSRPTRRGQPAGLPTDPSFFNSFSHRIKGKSTIEIVSSWEWDIAPYIEGRPPGKMRKMTQTRGKKYVTIPQQDGRVLVRLVPFSTAQAWIHPGFAKHTFIERGVRKGREAMAKEIKEEVMDMLEKGDPRR